MPTARIDPSDLRSFAGEVLTGFGVPEDHASICAMRLVEADLRGRHGHGVSRLPAYCDRIKAGGFNLDAEVAAVRETAATALVDGDNGLGQVVATFATELAIEKARSSGVAWIGIRRGNHAGAAGVYTSMLADNDLVGIFLAVANTNQMPPWGGAEPLLGTNPVSISFPAGDNPPFVLDIATTMVSFGEVKVAAREGRSIPEGWMVDVDGDPITDPSEADRGFLLPIGGYKGYGLSLAVGLLAGVMNGTRFGRDVIDHYADQSTPTDTGQTILAIRADIFRDIGEVTAEVDRHLDELRESPRMDPETPIRYPGEMSARREQAMSSEGVPVESSLLTQLNELARESGASPLVDSTR